MAYISGICALSFSACPSLDAESKGVFLFAFSLFLKMNGFNGE